MFRRDSSIDFSKESIALVNTSGGLKEFGTAEILLLCPGAHLMSSE